MDALHVMDIQLLQKYILRMPSFSATMTKVLEICNQPATSPNELNRIISLDPVLTGRVLKLVNSAFYSIGNEVTSLTRAIILLGLNTVKNLALSATVLESIGGKRALNGLSMDDFWTHSLGVGVIAKLLAGNKGIPAFEREDYFVAGLLHDLGKIPLNECYPEAYHQAVESVKLLQRLIADAESACLGIDHCAVGMMISEKWHLHQKIADAIRYHHQSGCGPEINRDFVNTVELANLCANCWGIGSAGDSAPAASALEGLLGKIGLSSTDVSTLHDKALDEIGKARIFLQVIHSG